MDKWMIRIANPSAAFQGQKVLVKGQICDISQAVVASAQLVVSNNERAPQTIKNSNGNFELVLCEGPYDLEVTADGFEPCLAKLDVQVTHVPRSVTLDIIPFGDNSIVVADFDLRSPARLVSPPASLVVRMTLVLRHVSPHPKVGLRF